MSRAYRIALSESVRRTLDIKDGIQISLELIPVLPADRMQEILAKELEQKGFSLEGSLARRQETDGIIIEIDMQNSTINITKQEKKEVAISHKVERTVAEEIKKREEEKLKQTLKQELEERVQEEQTEARKILTRELKGRLGDIQQELDQVVNSTISQALKEKAAQLGEIEEVTENEDGSISIRVNL